MKKLAVLILLFLSTGIFANAETVEYGGSPDFRATQTYPFWADGEIKTITYDINPGTGETTAKVTLDSGLFIWTSNEKARAIFCQARALSLRLLVYRTSNIQYTDVAIVNPSAVGAPGLRGGPPDSNGWNWGYVTTITYESSGSHMGSWRIVTSDNSSIWTTNATVLGIACEAYGSNVQLLMKWRSSSVYDYVALTNTVF
jgi:hypothetical protein